MACCMLLAETLVAQKNLFKKLLPDHAKLQYAGGIGFVSLGFGYHNRNQRLECDFYYGYVPEQVGGVSIHSVTVKLNWMALKTIQKKNLSIKPLVAGILVNYSFGKQYFSFNPRNYPYSYYGFPTSLHSALLVGSQLGVSFPDAKRARGLAFYYELLFFDQDIANFVGNTRSLQFTDILTLGLGIKITF